MFAPHRPDKAQCCEDGFLHGTAPVIYGLNRVPVRRRVNVRFGSKADMCSALAHVRFTPKDENQSVLLESAKGRPAEADAASTSFERRYRP
jgi:hypothetical protein